MASPVPNREPGREQPAAREFNKEYPNREETVQKQQQVERQKEQLERGAPRPDTNIGVRPLLFDNV